MMLLSSWSRLLACLLLPLLLGGCTALELGVMNHAGPIAASQWHLYVIVGIVLLFVAGPVLVLTPLIAWHYRLSNKRSSFNPRWNFSWTLEGLIWIPPIGIVVGLGVILWHYTHMLDPYRPIASSQPALEIQVAGFDWKWLFIYPVQHIAALDELVIPVGRPVHLSLTSGTVMQSLLIPQLAGQIYAMAGMTTQLNLAASRPGVFRGENTQFNGTGFQNEHFKVTALSPADYARWVARVRTSAPALTRGEYDGLFRPSSPARPAEFSAVPQNLFHAILLRSREPRE
jgi:cytochrome o ubiquinol oxidase subunit II